MGGLLDSRVRCVACAVWLRCVWERSRGKTLLLTCRASRFIGKCADWCGMVAVMEDVLAVVVLLSSLCVVLCIVDI